MLYLWIFLMIAGFVLLVKGADWLVEGASGIAGKLRVSPLVIGLTVVAFGTSAPELAVSVTAAIKHSTDIAVGNVVGSNLSNILLILGVSALIHELPVKKNSLVLDFPCLLLSSALFVALGAMGNAVEWWDGLVLLLVFSGYLALLFLLTRRESRLSPAPAAVEPAPELRGRAAKWAALLQKSWFLIGLTLLGLAMVVGGGTLLVDGAQYIAESFGVSERVIGLTIVAIGTSLPELVTSVVAAAKGETDIAVGNVIGSNIFNIFLVAGVSSLVYPLAFTEHNLIDALVALAAALLLFVLVLTGGNKVRRAGGAVLLACFVGYYVYLFLA